MGNSLLLCTRRCSFCWETTFFRLEYSNQFVILQKRYKWNVTAIPSLNTWFWKGIYQNEKLCSFSSSTSLACVFTLISSYFISTQHPRLVDVASNQLFTVGWKMNEYGYVKLSSFLYCLVSHAFDVDWNILFMHVGKVSYASLVLNKTLLLNFI